MPWEDERKFECLSDASYLLTFRRECYCLSTPSTKKRIEDVLVINTPGWTESGGFHHT